MDQGQANSMNRGLSDSRGGVIRYLNADDWLERDILVATVSCLTANPCIDMIMGNVIPFGTTTQAALHAFRSWQIS